MGGSCRVSRTSLGAVLLVGFLWFSFVGIFAYQANKLTTVTVSSTANFKLLKSLIGKESHDGDFGLNYVSKRRVPNGPDPIHNRRAGKSRQPPGRA